MQLPGHDDLYLVRHSVFPRRANALPVLQGYCEDVVGRFHGSDVRFHTRLKKPVMAKRSSRSLSRSSSRPSSSQSSAPPMISRESVSALAQRTSPSLPPAPSRMSYSYSAASISVTEDTSTSALSSPLHQYTSPPLPSSPHLPAPLLMHDESQHLRSASHSSGSTALDSAPRTPADFGNSEASSLVRIVSISRQVDSPTELDDERTVENGGHADDIVEKKPEVKRMSTGATVVSSARSYSPVKDNSLEEKEEPGSPSWLDTEEDTNSRISIALSDGEVGIGLSLLQDFAGGEGDDTISIHSRESDTHTSPSPAPIPETAPLSFTKSPSIDPPVRHSVVSERSSVYSTASHRSAHHSQSQSLEEPHPSFAASLRSSGSRASLQPSISDSEYGGEEWEGASDIYDNYRYSRYSMASKASRLSKSSMFTVASGLGLEPPPPVPQDGRRPSLDSIRQEAGKDRVSSSATDSSASIEDVRLPSASQHSSISLPSRKESGEKRVPPPLELASSNHSPQKSVITTSPQSTASPLLHGTFDSPLSSASLHSPAVGSPLSPPLTTPLYSNAPGGAASALRHRLEQDRSATLTPEVTHPSDAVYNGKSRESTMPIVVDDPANETDHEPRSPVVLSPTSTLR